MDKILPTFSVSLFDKDMAEKCSDLAGLSIDTVLDIATNSSIPIVSLLVGMGKIAQNIYDRNLLRQTIHLITERFPRKNFKSIGGNWRRIRVVLKMSSEELLLYLIQLLIPRNLKC